MAYRILDVSEWQGDIDFAKASQEIDGVILRVGGTGYGSSHAVYDDSRFEEYYQGFHRCGVPIGAYFYAGAISDAGVDEEINLVKSKLAGKEIILPVYYDVECMTGDYAELFKEERTRLALKWIEGIQALGYKSGLYTYLFYVSKLYMDSFKDVSVWMAQYYSELEYHGACDLWQFTSDYSLSGCAGRVDMSKVLNDAWYQSLVFDAPVPTPEPEPEYTDDGGFEMKLYTIGIHDEGNLVKSLQGILEANGYDLEYCGGCDGIFGEGTEYAVKCYQREHGLVADGVVGELTWGELLKL